MSQVPQATPGRADLPVCSAGVGDAEPHLLDGAFHQGIAGTHRGVHNKLHLLTAPQHKQKLLMEILALYQLHKLSEINSELAVAIMDKSYDGFNNSLSINTFGWQRLLVLCIKQEVKVHGLHTNKLLQTLGFEFLKAEIFEKQILWLVNIRLRGINEKSELIRCKAKLTYIAAESTHTIQIGKILYVLYTKYAADNFQWIQFPAFEHFTVEQVTSLSSTTTDIWLP